jgi:hypothetical protein
MHHYHCARTALLLLTLGVRIAALGSLAGHSGGLDAVP